MISTILENIDTLNYGAILPPNTSDDILIDISRLECINPPPSASSTPRDDAFSSDLSVICELFLMTLLILENNSTLDDPLDPNHRDLIVQETCPIDAGVTFLNSFHMLGLWTLPEHSIFRQKDVETSKQLADVVKIARKRYSKETMRKEFDKFDEWKGLMRKNDEGEETMCDISFLRNWIVRSTLTSLLSKFQHLMPLHIPSLPPSSHQLASSQTHPIGADTILHGFSEVHRDSILLFINEHFTSFKVSMYKSKSHAYTTQLPILMNLLAFEVDPSKLSDQSKKCYESLNTLRAPFIPHLLHLIQLQPHPTSSHAVQLLQKQMPNGFIGLVCAMTHAALHSRFVSTTLLHCQEIVGFSSFLVSGPPIIRKLVSRLFRACTLQKRVNHDPNKQHEPDPEGVIPPPLTGDDKNPYISMTYRTHFESVKYSQISSYCTIPFFEIRNETLFMNVETLSSPSFGIGFPTTITSNAASSTGGPRTCYSSNMSKTSLLVPHSDGNKTSLYSFRRSFIDQFVVNPNTTSQNGSEGRKEGDSANQKASLKFTIKHPLFYLYQSLYVGLNWVEEAIGLTLDPQLPFTAEHSASREYETSTGLERGDAFTNAARFVQVEPVDDLPQFFTDFSQHFGPKRIPVKQVKMKKIADEEKEEKKETKTERTSDTKPLSQSQHITPTQDTKPAQPVLSKSHPNMTGGPPPAFSPPVNASTSNKALEVPWKKKSTENTMVTPGEKVQVTGISLLDDPIRPIYPGYLTMHSDDILILTNPNPKKPETFDRQPPPNVERVEDSPLVFIPTLLSRLDKQSLTYCYNLVQAHQSVQREHAGASHGGVAFFAAPINPAGYDMSIPAMLLVCDEDLREKAIELILPKVVDSIEYRRESIQSDLTKKNILDTILALLNFLLRSNRENTLVTRVITAKRIDDDGFETYSLIGDIERIPSRALRKHTPLFSFSYKFFQQDSFFTEALTPMLFDTVLEVLVTGGSGTMSARGLGLTRQPAETAAMMAHILSLLTSIAFMSKDLAQQIALSFSQTLLSDPVRGLKLLQPPLLQDPTEDMKASREWAEKQPDQPYDVKGDASSLFKVGFTTKLGPSVPHPTTTHAQRVFFRQYVSLVLAFVNSLTVAEPNLTLALFETRFTALLGNVVRKLYNLKNQRGVAPHIMPGLALFLTQTASQHHHLVVPLLSLFFDKNGFASFTENLENGLFIHVNYGIISRVMFSFCAAVPTDTKHQQERAEQPLTETSFYHSGYSVLHPLASFTDYDIFNNFGEDAWKHPVSFASKTHSIPNHENETPSSDNSQQPLSSAEGASPELPKRGSQLRTYFESSRILSLFYFVLIDDTSFQRFKYSNFDDEQLTKVVQHKNDVWMFLLQYVINSEEIRTKEATERTRRRHENVRYNENKNAKTDVTLVEKACLTQVKEELASGLEWASSFLFMFFSNWMEFVDEKFEWNDSIGASRYTPPALELGAVKTIRHCEKVCGGLSASLNVKPQFSDVDTTPVSVLFTPIDDADKTILQSDDVPLPTR
ncbi:hypothetical protein BLNAU_11034 [Blattamonas nauphoetae]|uniref:Uncharacterized protein n=1 Tax=Blattamonas nauphoetae TaxID=2049346 RepID=A0ABQ9XST4_9EUKA|nr:hypothetical protein BLNAU_11034 [Blattamonas nauphoetae]